MSATVLCFRTGERVLRGPEATRIREARLRAQMGPHLPPFHYAPMPKGIA